MGRTAAVSTPCGTISYVFLFVCRFRTVGPPPHTTKLSSLDLSSAVVVGSDAISKLSRDFVRYKDSK